MLDPRGYWGKRPITTGEALGGAQRPWSGTDAQAQGPGYRGMDSPEEIRRCLSCTIPAHACRGLGNCGADAPIPAAGKRGRPPKLDRDAARRLYHQGYSDGAIARMLGVCADSVSCWRRKERLPVNKQYWSAKKALGGKPCGR